MKNFKHRRIIRATGFRAALKKLILTGQIFGNNNERKNSCNILRIH